MRLFTICLFLLLVGCTSDPVTPTSSVPEDERIKTLVDLGTGYLRKGDYIRAKEHLNRALSINPRSPSAHNTIALVFVLEQEYEIAEDHFRRAIRTAPDATMVRNNYGAFLFDRGRFEDAIRQLSIASEDRYYEGRPTVFENLGVSHLQVGDLAAAERAFDRAIALNPDQTRSLLELASIRYGQQAYVESRGLLQRHQQAGQPSAKSLWLCVRLARVFDNSDDEASCALALRNIFPASQEYRAYQESQS